MNFPKAKTGDVVVQNLQDETLIYNLMTNKAFCLNPTAAFVWQHADGQTPIKQIAYLLQKKLRAPVDESIIWFALETLANNNLLENPVAAPQMFAGMNRRELITVAGKSAAVAIPLVFSIVAPQASHAASGATARNVQNGNSCTSSGQCISGICSSSKGTCCRISGAGGGFCDNASECCQDTACSNQGFCYTPGPGGACVLYDTPITQADGKLIRARDVVAGQMLLGVNCYSGETIAGRVKTVLDKSTSGVYSLTAENGAVVNCSPSHHLIKGFGDTLGTIAEKFRTGDPLLVFDRESQKIVEAKTTAIEYTEVSQPVLMFSMDTAEHTFISGGIVSHNVKN